MSDSPPFTPAELEYFKKWEDYLKEVDENLKHPVESYGTEEALERVRQRQRAFTEWVAKWREDNGYGGEEMRHLMLRAYLYHQLKG